MSASTPSTVDALLTIRDMLRYAVSRFRQAKLVHAHGATTALDEAAYLILETLHLPVDQLEPFMEARLTRPEREQLIALIDRRVTSRLPAPYLIGRTYIQGVPFKTDARAIIPRSFIGELLFGPLFGGDGFALVPDCEAIGRVLDLCTGSGCLAVLAGHVFPNAMIDAVELSPDAAALARENIADSGMEERITLLEGDLFAPLGKRQYDLIITNPPYVDAETMAGLPPEFRAEPAMALAGGSDGFDIVRRILDHAADHLTPEGGLICEIGTDRDVLEREYPHIAFMWLDTAESEGEVFWLTRDGLRARAPKRRA